MGLLSLSDSIQCTCKWVPASITDRGVTLFNHQSTANTTRQKYIEHIHKSHRQTRRMLTDSPQQAKHHHGRCAPSLTLARPYYTITPTYQTPWLGCFTKTTTNHKALIITMQYAEAEKDTHTHLMQNNPFYHQHSVPAKIWRLASCHKLEWTQSMGLIQSGLAFAC